MLLHHDYKALQKSERWCLKNTTLRKKNIYFMAASLKLVDILKRKKKILAYRVLPISFDHIHAI